MTTQAVRNGVQQLHERAKNLLDVVRSQARRAFVIELTGTPKAGKSTTVATLESFFKEAGYRVYVLKERAATCPLPMKGHFFFNAWTTATMLAEVLEVYETDVDLLILDRGFFDALVWLDLQTTRGQVAVKEQKAFINFVLLDRWRSLVDAVVIMTTSSAEAIRRENANLLIPRVGGMMNPAALDQFNAALARVKNKYGARFNVESFKSSPSSDVVSVSTQVVRRMLPILERWADPDIAVVDRRAVTNLFGDRKFFQGEDAEEVLTQLQRQVKWMKRSVAERNDEKVQLTACGVHAYQNEIFVFERMATDKKAREYGRYVISKNCHVEKRGRFVMKCARQCLTGRIQEDLHLAMPPDFDFIGLIWNSEQKETKHLGIMFRVDIASEDVADHMNDKQFKKGSRLSRVRSFRKTQAELIREPNKYEFEPWSDHLVRNVNLTPSFRRNTIKRRSI